MNTDFSIPIRELFDSNQSFAPNWLSLIIKNELDRLPLPGEGQTLERWQVLAAVGEFDLSLAKHFEGHTDALAIFEEVAQDGIDVPDGVWCVWAAEAPGGRAVFESVQDGTVHLSGGKYWCSGATTADHALLTAWESDGTGPYLIALDLHQPGIVIERDNWKAVGMAESMSVNVAFETVVGQRVGKAGEYLSRPGFWHGGAGIAACWYGGAVGIAEALKQSLAAAGGDKSGFKYAALGRVEVALHETAAVLRQSASWIDDHPLHDARQVALISRLSAERCAKLVIDEVGRSTGAAPFCTNRKFAKAVADLPVFIRQSHADRDFAALGEWSMSGKAASWML